KEIRQRRRRKPSLVSDELELLRYRLEDGIGCNALHASWRGEDASVEARPARHVVDLDNLVEFSARAVPFAALGTEEGRNRDAEGVRDVHWPAIAAKEQVSLRHQRHESAQIALDARRPVRHWKHGSVRKRQASPTAAASQPPCVHSAFPSAERRSEDALRRQNRSRCDAARSRNR